MLKLLSCVKIIDISLPCVISGESAASETSISSVGFSSAGFTSNLVATVLNAKVNKIHKSYFRRLQLNQKTTTRRMGFESAWSLRQANITIS